MSLETACRNLVRPAKTLLERIVPGDALWFLAHRYAKWQYHHFLKTQLTRFWLNTVDDGPAIPSGLKLVTKASNRESFEAPYTDNHFFYDAYVHLLYFLRIVSRHSFNLRTMGSVLEFGCGSARLLRLFRCIEGLRLVGVDASGLCIDWCKENVRGPEYYVNELRPPLRLADNSFDLILAYSVFTHIPLDLQRMWLKELYRVLRPAGVFVCTVLGKNAEIEMLDLESRAHLKKKRSLTLLSDDPRASLSSEVLGLCDVFQTRSHMIESFGSLFCILDFIPAVHAPMGQDVLVLQK